MTTDELVYILRNPIDSKMDLLNQLRELEQEDSDPDLQEFLKLQIDQIVGIGHLIWKLDQERATAIQDIHFFPGLVGSLWARKPQKHQLECLSDALESLLRLVNSREWDLCFYRSWRQETETCLHCLKRDPVNRKCFIDPNGSIRSHYHGPGNKSSDLNDVWGAWEGSYCCAVSIYSRQVENSINIADK